MPWYLSGKKKHSQFILSSQFLCVHFSWLCFGLSFFSSNRNRWFDVNRHLLLRKSIKFELQLDCLVRRHVGHATLSVSVALSSKHSNEMERRSEQNKKKVLNAILFNSLNHACVLLNSMLLVTLLVAYYFNGMRDGKPYYRYQIQTHSLFAACGSWILIESDSYLYFFVCECVCVCLIRNFGSVRALQPRTHAFDS